MTKQVRVTYRSHRKAAWVVMLALVGVLAAVVIPLASGGSGKTYTLSGDAGDDVRLAGDHDRDHQEHGEPADARLGARSTSRRTRSRRAVARNLLRRTRARRRARRTKDIVALDDLNLAPNASKASTVTFKPGVTFNTTITAAAKQSNSFNDSSGAPTSSRSRVGFPTLKIVTCVTVSGRVYQDRNLDNIFTTGNGGSTTAISRRHGR